MPRVYGYIRLATVEYQQGSDVGPQAAAIARVCEVLGCEITRVYEDVGVPSSTPLEARPQGSLLYDALAEGDMLVVARLDRVFRSAADAIAKVREWRRKRIDLVVADIGPFSVTRGASARQFVGILTVVAEFERSLAPGGLARRLPQRSSSGPPAPPGAAPFGFRVVGAGDSAQLVPVPEQQAAIRTMLELRGRMSLRKIAQVVQEEHGIKISHEGVRKVFRDADRQHGRNGDAH